MASQYVSAWSTLRPWRAAIAACTASLPWRFMLPSPYSGLPPLGPGHQYVSKEDSVTLAEEILHTPVMLKEVLCCLNILPGQVSLASLSIGLDIVLLFFSFAYFF